MTDLIKQKLEGYHPQGINNYKNTLREIIQEITLYALSTTDSFDKCSFLGGTCLRIFHGLNRASEDLDFSLYEPDSYFSLEKYLPLIEKAFQDFGILVKSEIKRANNVAQSKFVKNNTFMSILQNL